MRELSAKNLIKLRKQAFEEFCWRLIREEYMQCFDPDAVELPSPPPEDHPDGGRDLQVAVLEPPPRRGHWCLLPKKPGRIFFSCKSHADDTPSARREQPVRKDGWKRLVVRDIDPAKVFDGKKRQLRADAAERAANGPRPSLELLNMLADGGAYWILINVAGARVPEFEADAARRLELYIQDALHRQVDLTGRIKVKDATFLAEVFNERPFALSDEQCRQLDLDEPAYLQSWDQWSAVDLPKRRPMSFESDGRRDEIIAAIRRLLARDQSLESNVVRIAGPPGVGKTRLVHHALEQPEHAPLHARIRYSTRATDVLEWLDLGSLTKQPDAVLVVDEVPSRLARALQRSFEGSLTPSDRARLILIGPQDDDDEGEPTPARLGPIDPATFRAIVENEVDQETERLGRAVAREEIIEDIVRLSEGYPLFAMWLTRALVEDPTLLAKSGSGLTDGEDPWRAVAAVLTGAPSEHGTPREWKREAELRGKALLLVLLVPDEPWDRLDEKERARLVEALGVNTWSELREASKACKARGLLRDEPEGHYYISPANLEYLVLDHFFGGPGDLDPEPLRRNLGARYERLLHRAAHIRVSDRCRERLARVVLERLERPSDEGGGEDPIGLELVAFLIPEQTALAIDRLVEDRGAEAIVADGGAFRRVCRALDHLRHRRLAPSVFEAVERAAFALAVESSDPWGAQPIWASLFRPVLHQTHRPFADRVALLTRRIQDPEPRNREVALRGVVEVVHEGPGGVRPGWDDIDGPWERPAAEEALAHRRAGWQILLGSSDDPDDRVAHKARAAIARELRDGVRASLVAAVDALPEHVARWTPSQRNALREALEQSIARADQRGRPLPPTLVARLDCVLLAMSPTSLQERLVAQVGRGSPGPLQLPTVARLAHQRATDLAIARELATDPDALAKHLSWLTSDEAVRASAFGHALGLVDEEQRVLAVLLHGRGEHSVDHILAGYMGGWAARGGAEAVDAWIESHADDPGFASLLARVIVVLGGSDARARVLHVLLQRGLLKDGDLSGLGFWGWHEAVSVPVLDELILRLAAATHPSFRTQGLGLMARRLVRSVEGLSSESCDAIHILLLANNEQSLTAVAERDWVEIARRWRAHGDTRVVRTVMLALIDQRGYVGHAFDVVARWLQDDAAEVWGAIVDVLGDDIQDRAYQLTYAFVHLRLLSHVPHDAVWSWIADDEERARAVASWTAPQQEDALGPLVRGLIRRFGAKSATGRVIADQVVSSGSEHDDVVGRVAGWTSDSEPEVAEWARSLHERVVARAALRRRRGYA